MRAHPLRDGSSLMRSLFLNQFLKRALCLVCVSALFLGRSPAWTQDSAGSPAPSGKLRLSQEIQLTGDSSWADTGIDVQPGEHVVATATGSLRYADQQSDTTPAGIRRNYKDLLRILPF